MAIPTGDQVMRPVLFSGMTIHEMGLDGIEKDVIFFGAGSSYILERRKKPGTPEPGYEKGLALRLNTEAERTLVLQDQRIDVPIGPLKAGRERAQALHIQCRW